jgi:SAM-dependent methyltransferase
MTADPDFFDDAYYRLIAPFHPEAETRHEVAAIRELLALSQDHVVLDLGCGWGRHFRLLREAGHRVVGLDLSHALLRRVHRPGDQRVRSTGSRTVPGARPRTRGRGPGGGLVAGDMRRLPLADGSFDAVINLATSVGLFLDDRDAVAALSEARRVLRPGGRLLVEGMHRDDIVAGYAERDGWTMEDGTEVRVRRRFDALLGVSHEVLRWSGPRGGGTKRHALRLRTATEMVVLAEAAGATVVRAYGGWDMEPFRHESERLVLVAGF